MIVKNLTKIIKNKVLFKELSFELNKGDRVLVQGESAAGKSSLARILAGLEDFTGELHFKGSIDLIFQDVKNSINPKLTIKEAITEGMHLKNLDLDYVTLATNFNLDLSKPTALLSSGEATRVAIARSLLWRPNMLIIDEALSYLDVITFKVVWAELQKIDILFVISHEMDPNLFNKHIILK